MGVYLGNTKIGLTVYEKLNKELTEQETLLNELEVQVDELTDKTSGEFFVKVIDYDGTILKEAWLDVGDTFTLPTPPIHDGLVFQEWSCSQEIVDGVITIEDNNVMAGAVYTTASGLSEFDIEITKAMEPDIVNNGFVVTLNMDGTKDWGDGTTDSETTHTYMNYGEYTIKCDGENINIDGSTGAGLFGQKSSTYNYYLKHARLSNIKSIDFYTFHYCRSLKNVTLPNTLTSMSYSVFNDCYSLTSIIIPNGVKNSNNSWFKNCYSLISVVIPNQMSRIFQSLFENCYSLTNVAIPKSANGIEQNVFKSCYSLTNIIIPDSVTSIGYSAFAGCYSLKYIRISKNLTNLGSGVFSGCYSLISVIIPNGVRSLDNNTFSNCSSLTSIKIPISVTSIGSSVFNHSYSLIVYDFSTHTQVPTLSSIDTRYINQSAKFIVPDELYNEWIVATNWVSLANYIYKASEVL